MRIGPILLLLVTLTAWRSVAARPAGVELWNTCPSGGPCSTTVAATPPVPAGTTAPTPGEISPSPPTEGQPGYNPPRSISDGSSYTYGADTITIQLGVTGGILIALGLHLMILGFRSFRPTLAVTGFLEFGLVTWIGLVNAKPAHGYVNDGIIMIAAPAGVAVLGAVLYAHFWFISYYLVGAMGGFSFGMFVLLWREDLVIVNDIGRYCFLGGLALVCAGLTKYIERHVVLKSTSFTGAFIFIAGVDCLGHVGYLSGIIQLLDRNAHHARSAYEIGGRIYGLAVGIILLFLLSFGWQLLFNLGRRFGVNGGIIARALQHHQEKEESRAGSSGGDGPSPRSSGEHQARSEHPTGNNLVDEVIHHIEDALESHGNRSNNSHHS